MKEFFTDPFTIFCIGCFVGAIVYHAGYWLGRRDEARDILREAREREGQ